MPAPGPRHPAPWLAALLVAALLAGGAAAHFPLRHAGHEGPRTLAGDAVRFREGAAAWAVVAPDLTLREGEGPVLAIPPGLPADGTWTLLAVPTACEGPGHGVAWSLAGRRGEVRFADCGAALWTFNWQPQALPPVPGADGTIALVAPGEVRFGGNEGAEPTVYQGLTPAYNLDQEDEFSPDYELLAGNSHPQLDRSTPMTDDDRDGIPNRADPDPWTVAWLGDWARGHGLPPPPTHPRADLLAEDHLRALARAHPELAPLLGEAAGYATPPTRGEAAWQTPAGAAEVAVVTVRNEAASQHLYRDLRDVLLDVPLLPSGRAAFRVDLEATRALAPAWWQVAAWDHGTAQRVLFQTRGLGAVPPGGSLDLPVAVVAADEPGQATWEVTLLFGQLAPERRFAFLPAEVVP